MPMPSTNRVRLGRPVRWARPCNAWETGARARVRQTARQLAGRKLGHPVERADGALSRGDRQRQQLGDRRELREHDLLASVP
jgi:hypothetical protein